MRDKIRNSKFVKWVSGWKLSKWLSSHKIFGKFCNYEFISYMAVGVLTTVISYVVFALFMNSTHTVVANTISFIAAVIFSYFANKLFVFDSPSFTPKVLIPEFLKFTGFRVLAYVFETLFIWLFADIIGLPKFWMKVVASIFVIIMNYFTGKFLVFIRKGETKNDSQS